MALNRFLPNRLTRRKRTGSVAGFQAFDSLGFLGVSLIMLSSVSAPSGDGSSETRLLIFRIEGRVVKHLAERLAKNPDALIGSARSKDEWRAGALEISHQRLEFSLFVDFRKGLDFRNVAEARMLVASRRREDRVKVNAAFSSLSGLR